MNSNISDHCSRKWTPVISLFANCAQICPNLILYVIFSSFNANWSDLCYSIYFSTLLVSQHFSHLIFFLWIKRNISLNADTCWKWNITKNSMFPEVLKRKKQISRCCKFPIYIYCLNLPAYLYLRYVCLIEKLKSGSRCWFDGGLQSGGDTPSLLSSAGKTDMDAHGLIY